MQAASLAATYPLSCRGLLVHPAFLLNSCKVLSFGVYPVWNVSHARSYIAYGQNPWNRSSSGSGGLAGRMGLPSDFRDVKELVDAGIKVLPNVYVRPEDERPSEEFSTDEVQIPVIDLSLQDHNALVHQVGEACKKWGFFQAVNHGFPTSVIDQMFTAAREFYALPNEEKMKYASDDTRCPMRYGTSFNVVQDKVLSWRDFLRHHTAPFSEMRELLPDKPASYRDSVAEYSVHAKKLASLLFELVSESLGLAPDYITKKLGTSELMVFNFYPPCPQPHLALGLPPHTDAGSMTLLMQENVTGLQILHSGKWVSVKPVPYAFIINLGDQLQILSNGRCKSAEHRALANSKVQRTSIAYLFGPDWECEVQPAQELVEEDQRALYRPILYREFMNSVQAHSLEQKKERLNKLKL